MERTPRSSTTTDVLSAGRFNSGSPKAATPHTVNGEESSKPDNSSPSSISVPQEGNLASSGPNSTRKAPSKFSYVPPTLAPDGDNLWVTLSFRCITWRFLNFSLQVSLDTPVEMIRMLIVEHHQGTISKVVMHKDKVGSSNLLHVSDTKKTLFQCGFKGGRKEDNLEAVIYYDFDPFYTGREELCVC